MGAILDMDNDWLTVDVKNHFETGDHMELVTPTGNRSFDLTEMLGRDGK